MGMLAEGNSDMAVCASNLLTVMQREIPFARSKGKPTDFTLLDGRKVKVPIMRTTCPLVRVDRERYVAAMADFPEAVGPANR